MRSIFLFLALFILFSGCYRMPECSVNVSIHSVDLPANEFHRLNVILMSEDDKTEQSIDFKIEPSIKINKLKPGNYQIIFFNRYEELVTVSFALNIGNETTRVDLMYDQINLKAYSKERRIDKLKNGDRLRIEIQSSGCFGSSEDKAVFYKENDQIFATNYSDTVLLDSKEVDQIRIFETELGYSKIGICTLNDIYIVFLNMKEILYVEDGSCRWNGYYTYIAPLFKNEGEE